jgi:hypothetical protein
MNMSNKESFTLNGVGLPFHVQGLPEPLAWIGLFHASFFKTLTTGDFYKV